MSDFNKEALEYHSSPTPGKIGTKITKDADNQHHLSLAYSPGVAAPVIEINQNPDLAYKYTNKGNLVAVISNGTAVLGLGNVGALASKPVMEGKALLFKRFADLDAVDIEVDTKNSQTFIETVAAIAPSFGGINLEDIKAPQCFEIEEALHASLEIPVFHDDQHGTAIIVAAALLNALELQAKNLAEAKIVCLGAGAAGIASMRLLVALGAKKANIYMVDSKGVITTAREDLNSYKFAFANETDATRLEQVIVDADVFVGVSGPNLFTEQMLKAMRAKPVVFALSNPTPEIDYHLAKATRDDVIMATGRSDLPNQVNNVLCFPYLFRGALDVRAKKINQQMQIAAVHAIANLAKQPIPEVVHKAYPASKNLSFSVDYILPKATDPRLKAEVSAAVAKAAVDSKVATLPYPSNY